MFAFALPPDSLGDFELTPELDARLNALAMQAKRDPAARNALYGALGFKITRFVRRYRYGRSRLCICEPEDVAQEAFLVFCEVVESWPGQESFSGYFFSRFPWRLARAVDIIERGWSAARLLPLSERVAQLPPLDSDDLFTLAEFGTGLPARDRTILELHIGYHVPLSEVARLLGVHPDTVYRAWARITDELRASLRGDQVPPRPRRGRPRRKRARGNDQAEP